MEVALRVATLRRLPRWTVRGRAVAPIGGLDQVEIWSRVAVVVGCHLSDWLPWCSRQVWEVAIWHSAWLASARVSVRLNRDCCLSSISRVLLKQFKLFNFVAWLINTLIRHCLLILYCIVWLQDDISEVVWNAWCLLVLEPPCIACGSLRKLIFHLEKLYITILGLDHWWLVVRVWNRRVDALKVMSLHVKSLTLVDLGGLVVAHARWLANRVVDALDEVLVVKQIWWC